MKEGILKEFKRLQYYQKPSEIKREKKKKGIKNYKKNEEELQTGKIEFHACAFI